MKYKKTIWCIVLLLFYFFFRFIVEGKTEAKSYYTITSYTSNAHGYLSLVSIATFNCFIFLMVLNSFIKHFSAQLLIRITRTALFLKNEVIMILSTLFFITCLIFPHVIFYIIYYGFDNINNIHFFEALVCQIVTLFLYYFTIGNIYMIIYIKCFRYYISVLIAFSISAVFLFANKIFNIFTPITAITAFSDYYEGNITLNSIYIKAFSIFIPIILIILILNLFQIKNKDIIAYEN